ncbi:DNA polymerase epsilon subunit [Babesia ovis]|uniref:DNA polymerase II subunit 2 n=1 Tax=Babesia ovis TaxID=5869 RepID=A0A9W5TB82_BABOV|nr:DNA polymerase epsilon subunit [Babesia ovis]
MSTLFDADISDSSDWDPNPVEEVVVDNRDGVYRLSSSLRRCGVSKLPPQDSLRQLLDAITSNPLRSVVLDTGLEVDIFLWNFVVLELSKATDTAQILQKIESWPYYLQKVKIESPLEDTGDVFVYNALKDIPTLHFCRNKRKFTRDFTPSDTSAVIEIRHELALEKCRRSSTNIATVDAVSRASKKEQLIIGIIGLDKKGDMSLKGTLTQLRLVFTDDTIINTGIYCTNNTVIVRGIMEPYKEAIRCIEIKHPPPLVDIEMPECFGGRMTKDDLLYIERRMSHKIEHGASERWLILSDLHLDCEETLNSFAQLLDTCLEMYQDEGFPTGFIVMGNFMSTEFNITTGTQHSYAEGFERLYILLMKPKYRILLMSSYFIVIPGPGDAIPCSSLIPMSPLLSHFTSNFINRMNNLLGSNSKFILSTNPCRIRHLTRRLIFCRNDILSKLLGTALLTSGTLLNTTPPAELVRMLVNTLFGQGHLCPNKAGTSTILKHDAALLLYPPPDLICIADRSAPSFMEKMDSTLVCNVDAFSKSQSFVSYDAISGNCQRFSL